MRQRRSARGISAQATAKISRRAFRGLLFCCGRVSNYASKRDRTDERASIVLFGPDFSESEQRALLSPVGGKPRSLWLVRARHQHPPSSCARSLPPAAASPSGRFSEGAPCLCSEGMMPQASQWHRRSRARSARLGFDEGRGAGRMGGRAT